MMAELKTQPTSADPMDVLRTIEPAARRDDCTALLELMKMVTRVNPVMWGEGMFGFGTYRYRYATGRTGEWFRVGFASRTSGIVLYLMCGEHCLEPLLAEIGPHRRGKACVYLKRLSALNVAALERLIRAAWETPAMGEAATQ